MNELNQADRGKPKRPMLLRYSEDCRARWLAVMLLLLTGSVAQAAEPVFQPAVSITAADPDGNYRMTRSTAGQLLSAAPGHLDFIYWEGLEDSTTPTNPSRIWFRDWSSVGGWSPRERVDQSVAIGGEILGGRHPSLARLADGSLLALWHDHRHGSAGGGWIDNLEIYADRRPVGETFSDDDLRLTASTNAASADNGYVAKPALLPDGRLAVTWYDFHWTPGISEIALRLSAPGGAFGAPPPMDDLRVTTADDRVAADANQPFTVPAIAADTSGTLHLCWSTGTTAAPASLYIGRYDPDTAEWIDKGLLHSGVRGYFDPPKLIPDPVSADVWLLFVDRLTFGDDEIMLQRRPAGAIEFDEPIRVTQDSASQHEPHAVIDPRGIIHLVYVDDAAPGPHVRYRAIHALDGLVGDPVDLSTALIGEWERPAIAHDADGELYVVFEDNQGLADGELWFTTTLVPPNRALDWSGYQ